MEEVYNGFLQKTMGSKAYTMGIFLKQCTIFQGPLHKHDTAQGGCDTLGTNKPEGAKESLAHWTSN
jgi:hypothetical protein